MFCFSHTAPVITKESEEREIADLTPKQKDEILDDLRGRNADELETLSNQEVPKDKLDKFAEALEKIPIEEKAAYIEALERCPDLLRTECKPALFLHCEDFHPVLAASRLVRYWTMRVKVFEEHAYLPITLAGAMAEDIDRMHETPHNCEILPNDDFGRTVICEDRNEYDTHALPRLQQIRILWYMIHAELVKRESATRSKGLVLLHIANKNQAMPKFDRITQKLAIKSYTECLPIRIRAFHSCAYSSTVTKYVIPLLKFFMDDRLRARTKVHFGPNWEVLESLRSFGLPKNKLPFSIGGTYEMVGRDANWFRERREAEG